LKHRAEEKEMSVDDLVIDLLVNALTNELEDYPSLEEVVARIKASPPNPANIHPATASLAELLLNAPEDPDFDLETWKRDWANVEAEIKAIERANDITEGRG
jgi:hypothetical protein